MSFGQKPDEKSDDDNVQSGATSTQTSGDVQHDVEKGPASDQQPPSREAYQQDDPFLVKWDDKDSANPRNWKTSYKAFLTFQLGMLALCGSLGSSIIAPAENAISQEFGVSREVTVLTVALYVLGRN